MQLIGLIAFTSLFVTYLLITHYYVDNEVRVQLFAKIMRYEVSFSPKLSCIMIDRPKIIFYLIIKKLFE